MKRMLCALLLLPLLAGCAVKPQPTFSPSPAVSPAPSLSPEQAELEQTSGRDDLLALSTRLLGEKKYEAAYAAAQKSVQLYPDDDASYTAAAQVLLEQARANYIAIDALLAQGIAADKENVGAIRKWVLENDPHLNLTVPFAPDYADESEINTQGIQPGNLTNARLTEDGWHGGFLSVQAEYVYFAAVNDNLALYKAKRDGSEAERVGKVRAAAINVAGNTLYFSNMDDGGKIYSMRTDGSNLNKLSDDSCGFLSVSGDWIYYDNIADQSRLYTIRTDGSERTPMTKETVILPCVYGEYVYYQIKRMDGGLCRMPISGGEAQPLLPKLVTCYCIAGDYLYYPSPDDTVSLRRMRLDGTQDAEVYRCPMPVTTLNVAGNRLIAAMHDGRTTDRVLVISADTFAVERDVMYGTGLLCTDGRDKMYFADWGDHESWYVMDLTSGEVAKLA